LRDRPVCRTVDLRSDLRFARESAAVETRFLIDQQGGRTMKKRYALLGTVLLLAASASISSAMTVEECLQAIQQAYEDCLGIPGGNANTCMGILTFGAPECVRQY